MFANVKRHCSFVRRHMNVFHHGLTHISNRNLVQSDQNINHTHTHTQHCLQCLLPTQNHAVFPTCSELNWIHCLTICCCCFWYLTESNQDRASNVSIMTGRSDGTTLLDGEVSVNCGTRLSLCDSGDDRTPRASMFQCESRSTNDNGRHINSICRISVDGKPNLEESEMYLLRCELTKAHARIEQLETSQNLLQDKLTIQSQRLLSLGLTPNRFDGSNLDNTNRANQLVRRFEHLYSQGKWMTITWCHQWWNKSNITSHT